MNKFSWYDAKSVKDAVQQVSSTVGDELYYNTGEAALFKSGGIDLLDMVKEGLISPKTIVNVNNIEGLNKISMDKAGVRIGANVTLAEIGSNKDIASDYPALQKAILHAATPQLRNVSTIAGNIAQRNRCWYFRSADHKCLRKGGDLCYARNSRTGENENHAILENGTCVSVHASSIATALMAYQGSVVITDAKMKTKEVPISEFFVLPEEDISKENILEPNDLITEIRLPKPSRGTKTYYTKEVQRESYDWSLADVAMVAEMNGNKCESITIVLGSAAPTPIRATDAELMVTGKTINEDIAENAAKAAMEKANPLRMNSYKVPLFESAIKKGLLKLS